MRGELTRVFGETPWRTYPALKDWYVRLKSRPCFRPLLGDRFLAMYGDILGGLDTDAHLVALDAEHGHDDVLADYHGFADAAGQNEHPALSLCPAASLGRHGPLGIALKKTRSPVDNRRAALVLPNAASIFEPVRRSLWESPSPNDGAEGATAPETLRPRDRASLSALWKALHRVGGATDGVSRAQAWPNSQVSRQRGRRSDGP